MKVKTSKKSSHQLRHAPLGSEIDKPVGKLKPPKTSGGDTMDEEQMLAASDEVVDETEVVHDQHSSEKSDPHRSGSRSALFEDNRGHVDSGEDSGGEDSVDGDEEFGSDDMIDLKEGYVQGTNISEMEEAVVDKFLYASGSESRTLADIIMGKLNEARETENLTVESVSDRRMPDKVVNVYTSVGKLLQHYRSGKLPKALKMLPHLKNWQEVLWLTRPDEWSPAATYACTRIFASNLNEKMAQRFFNMVLLEKCRADILENRKLNYYYFMSIRKALYKPAAFYKGFLLPLAQSGTCTLREAVIFGSALTKLSIPATHSAAVLLRLAELPYSGSTSLFIKLLLNKKYALPRRVIDALVQHFAAFVDEKRALPVIWHQSLLIFVQRYKFEFSKAQKELLMRLSTMQHHYQISGEVHRELSVE